MERELLETFEIARKAADAIGKGSSETSRCVDALKRLREMPVSTDVLISTQVGKRLRYLTKHTDKEIQSVASDLLAHWKSVVIDETSSGKTSGSSGGDRSSSKSETRTESPRPVKVERVEVKKREMNDGDPKSPSSKSESSNGSTTHSVKVEGASKAKKPFSVAAGQPKLTSLVNGQPKLTSLVKCNDPARDKIRELIADAFSRVYDETNQDERGEVRNILDEVDACDPIRVAVTVESALFEKLGRSTGNHKQKYRSIMFNLRAENNTDFRRKLLIGLIKPENLPTLTPEEMASDARKQENRQIKEKALFECERAGAPKATTDQFKCGRCGQRKTTYHQMQTRSADEPMTTFVTCVNCNHHWKFC